MNKENHLRILFVEDLPPDMELAEIELYKNGIEFTSMRVENKAPFAAALKEFNPDIVISDYSLPQFNGMEALTITREYDNSLPFIILTGTKNEEIAVECMKSGATDYVMKEHIVKLSFAVKEALRYRDVMRKKVKAEASLLESESRYRSMFENNYAVMLLVSPADGSIVDVNPAAEKYYGINREIFNTKNLCDISTLDKAEIIKRLENAINDGGKKYDSRHIVKSGIVRDLEIFLSPISFIGKSLIHCIIQDVTDRNVALESLMKLLNEKKELIREIYHRTKNNMQVIISMFSLQSLFTGDEKSGKVLKDMESRIRAMSLVHEKLYESKNLSMLDLKEYLTELVNSIILDYGIAEDKIEIVSEMENIDVLIDTAIPCGLVVNELVSNVLKHAFPDERNGKLTINLNHSSEREIKLVISDNGVGQGLNLYSENIDSMGLKIVKNIVEYQLKGNVELYNKNGIEWVITFKDNIYKARV